jgi:DNA repair protein RadD
MLTLRPYQTDLITACRTELRTHDSVLLQLPTGGGKTAIATQMMQTCASKQRIGAFIVHRQELVDQTMATFHDFGVPYGVISAGYAPNPINPIQICSIDTLRARLKSGRLIPKFDLMMWDEAHHIAAAGWTAVKNHFAAAKHVGLTATPERLDGKGLRAAFTAMVQGPTTAALIDDGYLVPYRAFAPSTPDLGGVHTKMGDYAKGENEAVMDRPSITGDAVGHYQRLARDKRALAFCVSVKHSQHVASQFRDAGVVAWHLDGDTDRGERRQAVAAFRRGEIKILCNVDLFGEGFDVPSADASIMLRPTKSLALYLQQCGRVLRPSDGKKYALLLDHAGNIARHGLPDDDREWSLDGRQARDKRAGDEAAIPVRQCPKCYACHRPAPVCPQCGWNYELKVREVDHVDGDLAEIDVEMQRRERLGEQAQARTIDALIELGRKRGYKSPEKWAAHLWTARLASRKDPYAAINSKARE